MPYYLARATQIIEHEIHYPQAYLDNVGALHSNLEDAQASLSIAIMREARSVVTGWAEFNILWDEPTRARCVARSFDAHGNKGAWVDAAIGQIYEMRFASTHSCKR